MDYQRIEILKEIEFNKSRSMTYKEIADYLNYHRIRTIAGKPWRSATAVSCFWDRHSYKLRDLPLSLLIHNSHRQTER